MLHLPGLLDRVTLERVRDLLATACWIDGRATAGHISRHAKRNRQLDEIDPIAIEAGALITTALEANAVFASAALPARIVPPLFNLYAEGEHYGPHIDGAVRPLAGAGRLRTDLSATVFLSDPADYDGGALCLRGREGQHEIRLPAGDMILYSSDSVHHVAPVTRGARLAAFFWVQSLVRDAVRRDMLHQFDNTVQQVAERLPPDSEALIALHGHYHNLLRMWGDI